MTVFVSTPYMDEAELCSRVAFMHAGRIVSCASPEKLRADYPYKLLELSIADRKIKPALQDCGLIDINAFGDKYHLVVDDPVQAATLVSEALKQSGFVSFQLEQVEPTLEDVFVALAGEAA